MSGQLITGMIHPQDYTTWTGQKGPAWRYSWTTGVLEYAIAALEGSRVLVEIDTKTGHAIEGVMKRIVSGGGGWLPGLVIESTDGRQTWRTRYLVQNIGTIVPLSSLGDPGHNAKWTMHKMMHDLASETLPVAKRELDAEKWWGTWSHRVRGIGEMEWTCRAYPAGHSGPPAGYVEPPRWGNVAAVLAPMKDDCRATPA